MRDVKVLFTLQVAKKYTFAKNTIKFSGNDAEGTAWVIAKSIAKRGTLNYKANAPDAIEEAIEKHNKKFLEKTSKRSIKLTLEELQEIYSQAFPDELEL